MVIILVLTAGVILLLVRNLNTDKRYCGSEGVTGEQPIQSHRSYCIEALSEVPRFEARVPTAYTFRILDDQGDTLKDFAIVHEKIMHFIVVRKDLSNFQHLHPGYDSDTGIFTVSDLKFPEEGEYRMFADFTPHQNVNPMQLPVTVYLDTKAGINYVPKQLPAVSLSDRLENYSVSLSATSTMLRFEITRDGKPVRDLEPYLGALGHVVAIKEGDLQFIHGHPEESKAQQNGNVEFMMHFPENGKYKVFAQFQHRGEVMVFGFVIEAKVSETMDHSTH